MCYYSINTKERQVNNMERVELKDRLQMALNVREKKPVDLARDLKISKSAISQYLSGNRTIKDSRRLYSICKYLDVSEAWMMGFDVPMERQKAQKNNDTIADIVVRMRTDEDFLSVVEVLNGLDAEKLASVKQMLSAFMK